MDPRGLGSKSLIFSQNKSDGHPENLIELRPARLNDQCDISMVISEPNNHGRTYCRARGAEAPTTKNLLILQG